MSPFKVNTGKICEHAKVTERGAANMVSRGGMILGTNHFGHKGFERITQTRGGVTQAS